MEQGQNKIPRSYGGFFKNYFAFLSLYITHSGPEIKSDEKQPDTRPNIIGIANERSEERPNQRQRQRNRVSKQNRKAYNFKNGNADFFIFIFNYINNSLAIIKHIIPTTSKSIKFITAGFLSSLLRSENS